MLGGVPLRLERAPGAGGYETDLAFVREATDRVADDHLGDEPERVKFRVGRNR